MRDTQALAGFLAELRYSDIPASVLDRTEDLFLDWLGSRSRCSSAMPSAWARLRAGRGC